VRPFSRVPEKAAREADRTRALYVPTSIEYYAVILLLLWTRVNTLNLSALQEPSSDLCFAKAAFCHAWEKGEPFRDKFVAAQNPLRR